MRFTALEHEGFSFFSVQIWDPRISGEKMQTESKTPRRCKSLLRTLVFVFFLRLFVGGGSEGGGVLFVFIVFVLFGWFSVKCRMDTRVQICCFLFRANGNSISASEAALKPLKMLNTSIPQPTQKAPERAIVIHWFPWNVTRLPNPTRVLLCNVDADWAWRTGAALTGVYSNWLEVDQWNFRHEWWQPKRNEMSHVFSIFWAWLYYIVHQKHLKPVPLASHKRHDGPPSPLYLGATHPAISGNHWLWITTCTWPRCFIQIAGVMEGSPWFTSPSIWPISHVTSYYIP